ncbi:hypothetical protein IW261DRAFT_1626833 [Armillaria novae-zelandiae]|uniref:Uncharacterized protein n=1 Tax=Armillaria novae-zelandiae TaxID=153914 RepID=A0AA39P824_9AGAR|nr:hypothetical protein IW261DRAFT_1626833 [Armillaria novae-zelandiae]
MPLDLNRPSKCLSPLNIGRNKAVWPAKVKIGLEKIKVESKWTLSSVYTKLLEEASFTHSIFRTYPKRRKFGRSAFEDNTCHPGSDVARSSFYPFHPMSTTNSSSRILARTSAPIHSNIDPSDIISHLRPADNDSRGYNALNGDNQILPTRVHNQMEFRPEYLYKLGKLLQEMILYSLNYGVLQVFLFWEINYYVSSIELYANFRSLKFDQMETFRIRRGQGLTILGYSRGRLDSRHVHAWGWRHVDQNNMQTVEKFSADVTSISNFKIKRLRTYFRTVRRLSKFRRVCRICAKSLFPTDTTTALGVPDRGTLNGRVIPSSMSEHAMSVYIRRDTPLIFFGRVFLNEFGDQSRSMVKRNGQYLSEIEVWKTG